jgi:hypothetical protein
LITQADMVARATEGRRQREAQVQRIVAAGRILWSVSKPADVLEAAADFLEGMAETESGGER